MSEKKPSLLSAEIQAQIDKWLTKYPPEQKRSALLPALHIVQDAHEGWLTPELIEAVAHYLEIAPAAAFEVATFYSMYDLKPVGRYKVKVCASISCMLRGSDELLEHIQKRLGIGLNETTPDGKFTLKRVECLAACGGAPAMMINRDYCENITPQKVDEILDNLE